MRAFDSRLASRDAPSLQRKTEVLRSDSILARQRAHADVQAGPPLLAQRKAACACGGGCPSCEQKERTQLQAKLQVSHVGDASEREADWVAEQVMRMPHTRHASVAQTRAGAERADGGLRVSRHSAGASSPPHISDAPLAVDKVLRSAGEPLEASVRAFMEPRFGHDFGNVRVHSNRAAAKSAGEISARAYTVGNHIVFGAGEYAPASDAGRQLLAHELAHTIQQGASTPHPATESNGGRDSAPVAPQRSSVPRLQRLSAPLIQRVPTDATVEAGTGVGPAIAAGTMTTEPAIHNQTVMADNCFGREGCNIRFHFNKAYKGDYNYVGGGGRTVRGVYVKISASYAPAACGPCHELRLLQVLRFITQTGGRMVSAEPDTNVRKDRAGWGSASSRSRGWMVDVEDTSTNPYYSSSWVGQTGSSTRPARLWDTPGHWATATNAGRELDTCLICSPASGASTVLACIRWGYYIDSSGTVAFRPAVPVAFCGVTQPVNDATLRWGRLPGTTPANIDFRREPPAPPAETE